MLSEHGKHVLAAVGGTVTAASSAMVTIPVPDFKAPVVMPVVLFNALCKAAAAPRTVP